MGVVSIIMLVLEIIKSIPDLIRLIKVIKDQIDGGEDTEKVNERVKQLTEALKNKDSSQVIKAMSDNKNRKRKK